MDHQMTKKQRIEWGAVRLELAGMVATSIAMFGCFAFGIVGIFYGFYGSIQSLLTGTGHSGPILINKMLTGLEMFFLAPLPLLAFLTITKLFRASIGGKPADFNEAHVLVVEVKRLIIGLMIAIVSTELIHRISDDSKLSPTSIAAMLGLIAALSLYYWASAPHH